MRMRERIEEQLLNRGVICATWLWENRMISGRNRISEMRADGWQIATEPCQNPYHSHDTPTIQYRHVPGAACACRSCARYQPYLDHTGQLRMPAAVDEHGFEAGRYPKPEGDTCRR